MRILELLNEITSREKSVENVIRAMWKWMLRSFNETDSTNVIEKIKRESFFSSSLVLDLKKWFCKLFDSINSLIMFETQIVSMIETSSSISFILINIDAEQEKCDTLMHIFV